MKIVLIFILMVLPTENFQLENGRILQFSFFGRRRELNDSLTKDFASNLTGMANMFLRGVVNKLDQNDTRLSYEQRRKAFLGGES